MSRADCASCWAIPFCTLCPAQARRGDGLSLQQQRAACAATLEQLERGLRIYISVAERDPDAWMRYADAPHGSAAPLERVSDGAMNWVTESRDAVISADAEG